jgi:hypothetical protein
MCRSSATPVSTVLWSQAFARSLEFSFLLPNPKIPNLGFRSCHVVSSGVFSSVRYIVYSFFKICYIKHKQKRAKIPRNKHAVLFIFLCPNNQEWALSCPRSQFFLSDVYPRKCAQKACKHIGILCRGCVLRKEGLRHALREVAGNQHP